MKTKLNELLKCPCSFTYKLMEIAELGLVYEELGNIDNVCMVL